MAVRIRTNKLHLQAAENTLSKSTGRFSFATTTALRVLDDCGFRGGADSAAALAGRLFSSPIVRFVTLEYWR